MYRILCYGDSNTWGFRPEQPFTRFPHDIRWTGVLRKLLGENYEVIEEGLNGRTTVWDDPFGDHKNGKTYLSPCLESHSELDLVIIMLGTNDLKDYFGLTAADVAGGLKALIGVVKMSGSGRQGTPPEILVVAPPAIGRLSLLAGIYGEQAAPKSKELPAQIQLITQLLQTHFMDAGQLVASSELDGVHWEADQHERFARAVHEKIKTILSADH
jgi:lysophospholipase L1-like esterase